MMGILSFVDSISVEIMKDLGINKVSFDSDFDKVDKIIRIY
jgi:predicted nucleic acid-binding protein